MISVENPVRRKITREHEHKTEGRGHRRARRTEIIETPKSRAQLKRAR